MRRRGAARRLHAGDRLRLRRGPGLVERRAGNSSGDTSAAAAAGSRGSPSTAMPVSLPVQHQGLGGQVQLGRLRRLLELSGLTHCSETEL